MVRDRNGSESVSEGPNDRDKSESISPSRQNANKGDATAERLSYRDSKQKLEAGSELTGRGLVEASKNELSGDASQERLDRR